MLESTASLLARVREGDLDARERLFRRYLPRLKRVAQGRLPSWARDITDTDDLVQNTLIRALSRLKDFEQRHEGALLGYLRHILLNQIRDAIRRAKRRPPAKELDEALGDPRPSPLEQAIGSETLQRYERGLARLSQAHREAVILRLEYGYTCDEVAEALRCPTGNAARQLIGRALVRLAQIIHETE